MTKQATERHAKFRHLPAKCFTKPDPSCSGCPQAAEPDHDTAATFGPRVAATAAETVEGQEPAKLQTILWRRQLDADGVPGSYNGGMIDSWKPYNASGSTNYADSASFEVIATSGKQLTLRTLDGSAADEIVLYTYRQRDPETGTKWVSGFVRTGAVKPGYVIQFSENSKISRTCWPVVTKIVSQTGDTLLVETDKAAPGALNRLAFWDDTVGDYVTDTNPVTCKVWHHEGNPPKFRKVIKPDLFPGKRQVRIVPLGEIPVDGILQITTVPVMHYTGFNPLTPTFTFEGQRTDTGDWETVPQHDKRLYQPDNNGAYVAFKTAKPAEGLADIILADDLTATYSQFRLSYWEKSSGGPGCKNVGYTRCMYSVPDSSDSVGKYSNTVGVAEIVVSETVTKYYQCLKHVYDDHTLQDNYPEGSPDGITDTAVHVKKSATGVSRYRSTGGMCRQINCCDHFTPAENGGDTAPFRLSQDGGHVYKELWGSVNQRLVRLVPRVQGFGAWQAQRVGHPSLCWHAGYVGLQTPTTIDEQDASFRGMGMWGTPHVYTDVNGNEHIGIIEGGLDGWRSDDPDLDVAGHFPGNVTGFTSAKDPLDPALTYIQREMEQVGPLVEKTTGELQTHRSIAQTSMAVAAQDLIIPDVSLTETVTQNRANGSFTRKTDGSKSIIKIFPLRQETKIPQYLGQRQVHSVTSLGDGRVEILWENGEHVWSFINDGPEIGDSYDHKVTFYGGGVWPIVPKPAQQIHSAYEPHKYAGSRYAGAWRGDALGVGARRFLIDYNGPHEGPEAPDWGSQYYNRYGYISGGVWRASEVNTQIPDTNPVEHGNITITQVMDTADSSLLTLIDSADRPDTIATEQYWTEANVAYLSPSDAGKQVKISYIVAGKAGTYEEYYTIPSSWQLLTVVPVADWNNADAKTVTANGEALTMVALGAADGEYSVDTSGTYVVFYGNLAQAGMAVEISLRFDTPAPTPEDGWCLGGNLLSFGKKYDLTRAYDDPDGFLMSLTPGTWVDFYHADAVMKPGATLAFVDYATNTWTAVPADVYHGTGEFLVDNTWFDGKTGNGCWKAVGVEWMDHRGVMTAAVINKTRAAEESLEWVTTGMFGGGGGSLSFGLEISQSWTCGLDEECNEVHTTGDVFSFGFDSFSNFFEIYQGEVDGSSTTSRVVVGYNSSSIGVPTPIAFLPDGTTIHEAQAEIAGGAITRRRKEGENPEYFDVGTVSFSVLGFTAPRDGALVGSIAGAGTVSKVVDFTAVAQAMFQDRGTGEYGYGYGVVYSPVGLTPGGLQSLLPGEGPSELVTADPGAAFCPGASFHEFSFGFWDKLSWDNISVNRVTMRVTYANEERERIIDWYPWPSRRPVAA